ncbi:MAG TPA: hypothetical protein VJP77_04610, partial [Planctomycetota bacterium]|nr:hypothetical protein [Planctomycetota bacterium]
GTATLSVCGEPLAAGASATLSVTGAVGLVPGFLVVSNLLFPQPFAGGIVLPSPAGSAFAVLAAPTDLFGQVTLTVPGGGGPAALGVQYLHYHPGLPQAIGITNAVQVNFLP